MTEKITIRRHQDGWHVTRPAFGFAAVPSVTTYPTWKAAIKALHIDSGSGAQLAERRNDFTVGKWPWGPRPRWIEASA